MKERPILFSGPMVRALLSGQKTQTRGIVKYRAQEGKSGWHPTPTGYQFLPGGSERPVCPYGRPADRLWVRETWGYRCGINIGTEFQQASIEYQSDNEKRMLTIPQNGEAKLPKQRPCAHGEDYRTYYDDYLTRYWRQWRPSIFMPRWASRITLEITGVQIERLQGISEADAAAEGWTKRVEVSDDPAVHFDAARDWYSDLWDQINGPGSWAANPWVWVVEFRKVKE